MDAKDFALVTSFISSKLFNTTDDNESQNFCSGNVFYFVEISTESNLYAINVRASKLFLEKYVENIFFYNELMLDECSVWRFRVYFV